MEQFKIYVNRLNDGQAQHIDETVPPDFLGVQEEALTFQENIHIAGDIYTADDHLITHLDIETSAFVPCSICNESVRIPILIKNLYLSKPVADIKGAIYDLIEDIRESILIQVPQFTECNKGQCPNRQFIQQFLEKKSQEKVKAPIDTVHFPFSEL